VGSEATAGSAGPARQFDELYSRHFDFVWRLVRRLGVHESNVDDAVQDVFLVVYRRLGDFQHRSSERTWIAGIAVRVASDERRRVRRKGGLDELDEQVSDGRADPHGAAVQSEARRRFARVLERLDVDRREIFVLAELEQMTAPEISEALGVKLNTVYSRLRLARQQFEEALGNERRQER
jgi:RNA polymerase sigma-70 factor (ECF subfamily)